MLSKQNRDIPLDLDIATGLCWQLTNRMANELNVDRMAWHDGLVWHFASSIAILPEHKLGVVVATNTDKGKKLVSRITTVALKRLLWDRSGVNRAEYKQPAKEIVLRENQLNEYAGYYDTAFGVMVLKVKDGYLQGEFLKSNLQLVPLQDKTFKLKKILNAIVSYVPPELEGMRLKFVKVDSELLLATMDKGNRIPLGRKIEPVEIPKAWKKRLGTYVNSSKSYDDFVQVKTMTLRLKDNFLLADVTVGGDFTSDMNFTVALEPTTTEQAFVMGVGRYRGDMIGIKKRGYKELLRFQGYHLKRSVR